MNKMPNFVKEGILFRAIWVPAFAFSIKIKNPVCVLNTQCVL